MSEQNEPIMDQFTTINDSLSLFKIQLTALQKIVRTVEKDVRKELKTVTHNKHKEKNKPKRAPSGFAKPTKVTKELCEFMNKPEGTEIARTEVTKTLVRYIKEHNLIELGEDGKNRIVPDEKLKILLGITDDDDVHNLTYFTIQKHMNKHFYTLKKTGQTDSL